MKMNTKKQAHFYKPMLTTLSVAILTVSGLKASAQEAGDEPLLSHSFGII